VNFEKPIEEKKETPHNRMLEAVVKEFHRYKQPPGKILLEAYHAAAKNLLSQNAKPEEISARVGRYRRKHPSWGPCTPHALSKYWATLAKREFNPEEYLRG